MAFVTQCKGCGGDLYLTLCIATNIKGVRIMPDGFALSDARRIDTEEEWVRCNDCHEVFELESEEEHEQEI